MAYAPFLVGFFIVWLALRFAPVVGTRKIDEENSEPVRMERGVASVVRGLIQNVKPRRADPSRTEDYRNDECYFIGPEENFAILRDALRRQGLEYKGDYFRTSAARHQRIFASEEHTAEVSRFMEGNTQSI